MLLLLLACRTPTEAPCPTFSEIGYADEVGDPEALETVRQAVEDFASWTSRAGVCVAQIALLDGVSVDGAAGVMRGERIEIDPHATYDLRGVTFHELCHAWDYVEGNPSLDHPDLFPLVSESEDYPTEKIRASEAFAEVCEDGPRAVAASQLGADLCDAPAVLGDAEAWVRDNVYDAFVDELDAEVAYAPFTVTRESLWTDAGDARLVVAPAGDALAILRIRFGEETTLRVVDPVSLAVAEFALPDADTQAFGLLGSDGDPIFWSAHPLRVWRIDPTDGTATPLSVPDDPDTPFLEGFVHGDRAWIQPLAPALIPPYTIDLTTGTTGPLLGADDAALTTDEVGISGNGDRVALYRGDRTETWSFAESAWSTVPHPSFLSTAAVPLRDGRLAGAFGFSLSEVGSRYVPVVVDPDTQVWTFPDTPCDASGWQQPSDVVTLGDALYALDGGSTVELVRVGW